MDAMTTSIQAIAQTEIETEMATPKLYIYIVLVSSQQEFSGKINTKVIADAITDDQILT